MEHHIAYLTHALRKRGHEVNVLQTGSLPQVVEARGATNGRSWLYPCLGSGSAGRLDMVATLARRLAHNSAGRRTAQSIHRFRPDVIHQHCYLGGILTSCLLLKTYPVVFTNHTGAYLYLDRWPFTRVLQRQLMKLFTAVIGPSRELVPQTRNSHYIPNGVDTAVFYPRSEEERVRLRKKWRCDGKRVYVCPRRWAPTKGIIYLARALALLSAQTREHSVILFAGNETAGYEQYQQSVASVLRRVGPCDIRVLGNLGHPELAELMSVADVCIIPSVLEATSLACLEAMACGTSVLATSTGGLVELIQDGANGWLVPPENASALGRALERIARMSEFEIQPIRADAVESVRRSYTWDLIAAKTETVYSLALKQRAALRDPRTT